MQQLNDNEQREITAALNRLCKQLEPFLAPERIGKQVELFNGSTGIVLFYLRMYEYCQEPGYRDICIRATEQLLQQSTVTVPAYYTFYTGATGLVYLCIKMHEVTAAPYYLEQASNLVARYAQGIRTGVLQDDLLSGHAGNILLLTYLHSYTKSKEVYKMIRQLTDIMIQHARISPQGLKWGHVKMSYDCLTGFSHGASGIAYALMQAAGYFRDEELYYLAYQALEYEMQYYDRDTNNWLDLRLTSTHIHREDIHGWEISSFRKYTSNVNSWAHGAAGIGIARLLALNTGAQPQVEQHVRYAVQRCLADTTIVRREDFTLCSGNGGIFFFLLKAAEVLRQPELRGHAQQIALQAVRYYERTGTYNNYLPAANGDGGLFSGLAGVGYMLLAALSPYREDAVLHPVIKGSAGPLYQPGEVKRLIFCRHFGYTVKLLEEKGLSCDGADMQALENNIGKHIAAIPPDHMVQLRECFTFEKYQADMWRQHKGLLYHLRKKELLLADAEELLKLSDGQLLNMPLAQADYIQLCHTPWPWHLSNVAALPTGSYHYLLVAHEYGISSYPLGDLPAAIFQAMQEGRTLKEMINGMGSTHDPGVLVKASIAQLKEMLRMGFVKRK